MIIISTNIKPGLRIFTTLPGVVLAFLSTSFQRYVEQREALAKNGPGAT